MIEVTNIRPALGPAPFTVTPRIENRSGWATVSLTSTATGQEKRAQIGLFTVEFKAIGIGRSAVVLTGVAFMDVSGSPVPVEVDNGELEISGE